MRDRKIGKRYAEAIFSVAEDNKNLLEVYGALNSLMEEYENNKEFKNFINHPLISNEDKKEVLIKVYKGLEENILNIILYLLDKKRIENIKDIVVEYLKIYYAKNNIIDVEGTFASELSKKQEATLLANLEKRTNKKVNLTIKVDKSIIGGGILKIGDKIMDGTIRTQLNKLVSKN